MNVLRYIPRVDDVYTRFVFDVFALCLICDCGLYTARMKNLGRDAATGRSSDSGRVSTRDAFCPRGFDAPLTVTLMWQKLMKLCS